MALVYCDHPDGTLTALEDDILVSIWRVGETSYACEIWLGDEVPAYANTALTVSKAKEKVDRWLTEALSYRNETSSA